VRVLPGQARDGSMTILRNGVGAISKRVVERHFEMAPCPSMDWSLTVCGWVVARLWMGRCPSVNGTLPV
jgi:hypothetical protein